MKEDKKQTITDKEHFELWSKLVKQQEDYKIKERRIKKLIEINAKIK